MPVLRYKCHDSGRDATAEASRAVETCSCVREPPATFPCQPRWRHEKRARPPGRAGSVTRAGATTTCREEAGAGETGPQV